LPSRLKDARPSFEPGSHIKIRLSFFPNAATVASGLRVPGPLGDLMILSMLRQTKGTALTVTDEEMLQAGRETGLSRRHIRRSRRRRDGDRNKKARRLRLDQAGRNCRAL